MIFSAPLSANSASSAFRFRSFAKSHFRNIKLQGGADSDPPEPMVSQRVEDHRFSLAIHGLRRFGDRPSLLPAMPSRKLDERSNCWQTVYLRTSCQKPMPRRSDLRVFSETPREMNFAVRLATTAENSPHFPEQDGGEARSLLLWAFVFRGGGLGLAIEISLRQIPADEIHQHRI